MVIGFTTTYAISAYHYWCEFESLSGRDAQHYVIKFVSDLRVSINETPPRYNWNIVESGIKHHKTKPNHHIMISSDIVWWEQVTQHPKLDFL
jgi:hypothetical protein